MEILELKNTKIKNSLDGQSGRMEMTVERSSELEDVPIQIILQGQYEKKYKNGDAYFAVIATSAFSPKTSFVHVRVTKQQWEELNTNN